MGSTNFNPRNYFPLSIATWILGTFYLLSPPADAAGRLKAIVILDAASPEGDGSFAVLQGHTADLSVDLQVERAVALSTDLKSLNRHFIDAAQAYQADIVFFSDFGDADQVVVYVSMPKLGTTLVRNIDAGGETIESRFEITAVIIRGILTVMAGGGEIGVHVPDAPDGLGPNTGVAANESVPDLRSQKSNKTADATDVTPSEKAEPKFGDSRLELQASYGLALVSSEIPLVQSFRPAVRLPVKTLGVFVAYRFTMPFEKEDATVSLTLFPHPIEVGFWSSFQRKNFFFHLGAAAVFDPLTAKVTPKTSTAEEKADTTNIRFAVSPFIAIDWFLSPRIFLNFSISADVYVYQNAFYTSQDSTKAVFLSLWTVSPLIQIGFGFGAI